MAGGGDKISAFGGPVQRRWWCEALRLRLSGRCWEVFGAV